MRIVKDIPDIQRALNELFGWKDKLTTKPWDFHQLRITNAAPALDPNDYVILSQIPTPVAQTPGRVPPYTIVFTPPGVITVGTGAPFVAGRGRSGIPIQVWLAAQNKPTSGPLSINININGTQLLSTDLTMNPGDDSPVISSTFASSIKLPYLGTMVPLISSVGGAALVSIGVVIRLDDSFPNG